MPRRPPPASPTYPNASTGQPPRPPQPGGAAPGGRRSGAGPRTGVLPGPARRLTPGSPVAVTSPAGGTAAGRAAGGVRPSPRHRHRRMRTPGGARRGGLAATRSRAVPAGPADRRSRGRRIAVELGRVPDGRARRARSGPRLPAGPGAPDPVYPPGQFSPWNSAELRTAAPTAPGYSRRVPAPSRPNPATHNSRSATRRPTPPPPRPGPCWTRPSWPRMDHPGRQDAQPGRRRSTWPVRGG